MEEKGIEWVCPNCQRKKAEEEKMKLNSQLGKQKKIESVGETSSSQAVSSKEISPSSSSTEHSAAPASSTMQCVVCKKEARNSTIYCSDACILAHAQETLTKEKPVPSGSNIKSAKSPAIETVGAKSPQETRVIVFDRKSGKFLTGKYIRLN